jgi:hypothetical protein
MFQAGNVSTIFSPEPVAAVVIIPVASAVAVVFFTELPERLIIPRKVCEFFLIPGFPDKNRSRGVMLRKEMAAILKAMIRLDTTPANPG